MDEKTNSKIQEENHQQYRGSILNQMEVILAFKELNNSRKKNKTL